MDYPFLMLVKARSRKVKNMLELNMKLIPDPKSEFKQSPNMR